MAGDQLFGTVGAKGGQKHRTRENPSKTLQKPVRNQRFGLGKNTIMLQLSENHGKPLGNYGFGWWAEKGKAHFGLSKPWNPLEAIGKCANENAMDYLIFHEPTSEIEETGKIWGIYNGMLRGQLKENHLRIVVAHLSSQVDETREAAVHVLLRQSDFDLNK